MKLSIKQVRRVIAPCFIGLGFALLIILSLFIYLYVNVETHEFRYVLY